MESPDTFLVPRRRGFAGAFRPLREPESDVRLLQRQGLPGGPAKICAHQLGMQLWDGAGSCRPQSGHIPPRATAGENPHWLLGRQPGPAGSWASSCPSPSPSSLGTLQVGEDVPDARKCACASHVAKVAEFFQVCGAWVQRGRGQSSRARCARWGGDGSLDATETLVCFFFLRKGVDVIVNASSVEDIDAGAIGQRLSNGLARLSSPVLHRLRLREDENAEPVVSVLLAGLAQMSPV